MSLPFMHSTFLVEKAGVCWENVAQKCKNAGNSTILGMIQITKVRCVGPRRVSLSQILYRCPTDELP